MSLDLPNFGPQQFSSLLERSIGAVAELFDASCFFQEFPLATNTIFTETEAQMRSALGSHPLVLGRHYFVKNPTPGGSGVVPTFDFRADSQTGNPDAYVIATKIGDIPSPFRPSVNIDWLELKGISGQGTLAKFAFRILTSGGQPPLSASICM